MIKLRTNEIKRFLSNASLIKSKGVLPVLDYILINDDKIIKTNLEAYISMDITPIGQTILLDENILSGLVKRTTSDTIEVTIKKDAVYFSDGKYKPYFTLSAAEAYPEFPDMDKVDEVLLSEDILKSIGVAAKNIGSNTGSALDFVHLSHDYVFAADNFRYYFKKFESLPTVSISSLCANIISQFGAATYYKKGNFDFYSIGSLLYGFKMQEVTIPNFTMFLNFVSKDEYMEMEVAEVLEFLDFLSSSTSSLTTTCNFDGTKLSFEDVDLSVGNEVVLTVEGSYKMKKSFLPRIIAPFLKSIGQEKIRFSPMLSGKKGITVWSAEDENLTGMVGEVSST